MRFHAAGKPAALLSGAGQSVSLYASVVGAAGAVSCAPLPDEGRATRARPNTMRRIGFSPATVLSSSRARRRRVVGDRCAPAVGVRYRGARILAENATALIRPPRLLHHT